MTERDKGYIDDVLSDLESAVGSKIDYSQHTAYIMICIKEVNKIASENCMPDIVIRCTKAEVQEYATRLQLTRR